MLGISSLNRKIWTEQDNGALNSKICYYFIIELTMEYVLFDEVQRTRRLR